MRLFIFSLFFLVINANDVFSQTEEDVKKRMEKLEKEILEKEKAYIENFVSTLEVDNFQEEIIKQKMYSYFEAKKAIYMSVNEQYKRDELLLELDATHFSDIEDIITKDTMTKIMEAVKGSAKNKDKKKKKKNN